MKKLQFITMAAIIAAAAFLILPQRAKPEIQNSTEFMMSTEAQITLFTANSEELQIAFSAMRSVERTCNVFNPSSELSQLNATAADTPFTCSDMLYEILKISQNANDFSDGKFDVTSGSLMKLWGFYRKQGLELPSELELSKAKNLCGMRNVIFNDAEKTIFFKVKGMSIDLGGIAKGYAADLAAEAISLNGSTNAGAVNLGGNIRTLDLPMPDSDGYVINIRNPLNSKDICKKFTLLKGAVSTSGNYERYVVIDGKRYTHIMNPVTAQPVENILAVTVVARNAVTADWLSTSIFIGGEKMAQKAVSYMSDVEVWLFLPAENEAGFELRHFGNSPLVN